MTTKQSLQDTPWQVYAWGFGKHKFKVGQRVRPSAYSMGRFIFPKTRAASSGVVTKVDEFNCPTVLWDHRKTTSGYHPNFIAPDRRRPPKGGDELARKKPTKKPAKKKSKRR